VSVLLIDDKGDLWGNASIQLRQSFGPSSSDDDLASYLVKNLGFIAVNVYDRSCQIRVRPSIVAPPSVNALIYWLSGRKFDRLLTSYFEDDWRIELHGAVDLVAQRLLQAMNKQQLVRPGDFVSKRIPLDQLPNSNVFASLLTHWPMLSSSVHQDGIRTLLHQLTHGRYFLVRESEPGGQVVFQDVGSEFATLDKEWLSSARGMPVEHQSDPAYGCWIEQRYRQVLAKPEIITESVDAIVSTRRFGRYRIRYNRIILPAEGPDGKKWLLCSSELDHGIDHRIQPSEELPKVG
jgi:hypothetical protein